MLCKRNFYSTNISKSKRFKKIRKIGSIKMHIEDCLFEFESSPLWLGVRIFLYVLSAILGVIAAVAMAVAKGAFYHETLHPNGLCVLFGYSTYRGLEDDKYVKLDYNEHSSAICFSIIVINSVATVALPFIVGIILLIIIRRALIMDKMRTRVVRLGMLIFSIVVLVTAFTAGVIATSGYNVWCSSLLDVLREGKQKASNCSEAIIKNIPIGGTWESGSVINYTKPMDSLVVASWILVAVWTVICIIEIVAFRRSRVSPPDCNSDRAPVVTE
ncbi:unnamed protein product [Owenia fusiformis]|uniref:Uncharacterized protein n=1 Tax=Owenia fusiformis TaxID=6347 RepID=A0A8S4Q589_OWEFU|nr:unnamed protein product [Owenia fusiformis]